MRYPAIFFLLFWFGPLMAQTDSLPKNFVLESQLEGPVQYYITGPQEVKISEEFKLTIDFELQEEWYLYADHEDNLKEGYIPTTVVVKSASKWLTISSGISAPEEKSKANAIVYSGNNIRFVQKLKLKPPVVKDTISTDEKLPKSVDIKVMITFQTCNNKLCLPPVDVVEEVSVVIR